MTCFCHVSKILQRADKFQYFIDMAIDFDFAPFVNQMTFGIDHKGAALDADDLFAVHHFLFDDLELTAQLLLRVAEELKR